MIYVITQNNEIIFTTHLRETFDDYIDGLCIKYEMTERSFVSKIKLLNEYNINYYTISPTFKEE